MPNAKPQHSVQPEAPSFPEALAQLFDSQGWTRLVGRVIGELMLAEEAYLSTVQLCERIGVSKGHLSSAIQQLEQMRYIDRFGQSGTRQHFYRLRPNVFARAAAESIDPIRRMAAWAQQAIETVPPASRAAEELTHMRDFYRLFEQSMTALAAAFVEERS